MNHSHNPILKGAADSVEEKQAVAVCDCAGHVACAGPLLAYGYRQTIFRCERHIALQMKWVRAEPDMDLMPYLDQLQEIEIETFTKGFVVKTKWGMVTWRVPDEWDNLLLSSGVQQT